jgi:hypothetical protein
MLSPASAVPIAAEASLISKRGLSPAYRRYLGKRRRLQSIEALSQGKSSRCHHEAQSR